MQIRLVPLILALGVVLAACKSASYQWLPLPPQDVELSRPDLARVYVLRDAQLRGKVRNVRVFQGPNEVGSIGAGSYLCWERRPGRSLVRLIYEGPVIDGGEMEGVLDLQCAAGEVYYYVVKLNHVGKPHAERVRQAEGVELVAGRSPAAVRD